MEFSWHYERQMHMGFTFMLAKILQKLYGDDKEKLAQALQRHMEFFNCTPALSTFIGGIVASMEEKRTPTTKTLTPRPSTPSSLR